MVDLGSISLSSQSKHHKNGIHKSCAGYYAMGDQYDDIVIKVSALQSIDMRFICFVESYQKTLKNGLYSFPAGINHKRNIAENKSASLLVVSLGRHLTEYLHLYVENRR